MNIIQTAILLAALVLATLSVFAIVAARAELTCQTSGDYTYCWNSSTKKGTTCQTVNGYTYCN